MAKLRILFVDDEEKVLQGLKRMLHSLQGEWEMAFVGGGREALEFLERQEVGIIVSDMRMPGMDGARLLQEVMEKHPKVIRFILSGHSDREMILRAVGTAHQYLIKPCEPEELKAAIRRALALRRAVGSDEVLDIVSKIRTLPSLPDLYRKLMLELQSPEPSIQSVGCIITEDLSMTAKILQLVNSAFFGLPRQISDPKQAVSLLGLEVIRALVLSIHVFTQFEENQIEEFSIGELFQHSVRVGNAAKKIAATLAGEQKTLDDALSSGMLHDIGHLLLAIDQQDRFREALVLSRRKNQASWRSELEVFGTTHAEIGAYLIGLWGLPDPIVEAIAFHHYPSKCAERKCVSLAAVHVADYFDRRHYSESALGGAELDTDYLSDLGVADKLARWEKVVADIHGV